MSSGERPIGAAKGKQPDTEALCQPPPPQPPLCVWPSGASMSRTAREWPLAGTYAQPSVEPHAAHAGSRDEHPPTHRTAEVPNIGALD